MQDHPLHIVFSSGKYRYTSELPPEKILEIVFQKIHRRSGRFSRLLYTGMVGKAKRDFMIIRRGQWFPVKITGNLQTDSQTLFVNLEFQPLINPFFILTPSWAFLLLSAFSNEKEVPFLTSNGFGYSLMWLVLITIIILFYIYIPIKKEMKILEKELMLTSE